MSNICELCHLTHELPSPETSPTTVARDMIEATARAMEVRRHFGFAKWLRRLNRSVDLGENAPYLAFNRVFTVFRIMCLGQDYGNADDLPLISTMRRKFPKAWKDQWVRALAGEFVAAAPVDWPGVCREEEEDGWQDFIDGLHGIIEKRPVLLFTHEFRGRSGLIYPSWTMDLGDDTGYPLLHAAGGR